MSGTGGEQSGGVPAVARGTLLVIVAAALVLRLWGIRHGLPYVYHVDENFEVYRALRLAAGSFDFDRIAKGGLFYLLFVEYGAYFVLQYVSGKVAGAQDFARSIVADPSAVWMIGRVTVAVIGALNVWVVHRIGVRARGETVGMIAAFLFAVAYLPVTMSHVINVDVPMTALAALTLLYAMRVHESGRRGDLLIAAVLAALAAMTKLPAVLLVVPVLLARGLHAARGGVRETARRAVVDGILFLVTFGVVYCAGNPGILFKAGEVVTRVFGQFAGEGWTAEILPGDMRERRSGWAFYLGSIVTGVGWPVAVAAGVGALVAARDRIRSLATPVAFVVLYFAVLSLSRDPNLIYERYVLPMIPVLAVLAAVAIAAVADRWRMSATARTAVLAAAAVLVAVPTARDSIAYDRLYSRTDTRTLAKEWIDAHVRPGATVYLRGNPEETSQQSVPVESTPENLRRMAAERETSDPGKAMFLRMRADLIGGPAFDVRTSQMHEPWPAWEELEAAGVEYVVLRHRFDPSEDAAPTARIPRTRFEFDRALNADPDVRLVASFDPETLRAPGPFVRIYRVDRGAAPDGEPDRSGSISRGSPPEGAAATRPGTGEPDPR